MMKTLEEYMKLPYKLELVEDTDEGGFVASYPDLKGCITCGETAEKAVEMARDAKRAWLEAAIEDGYIIPEPNSDELFSGQFKFRLPKSLHRSLSENAKKEGVSMNQYCIYLLTKYDTAHRAAKAQT